MASKYGPYVVHTFVPREGGISSLIRDSQMRTVFVRENGKEKYLLFADRTQADTVAASLTEDDSVYLARVMSGELLTGEGFAVMATIQRGRAVISAVEGWAEDARLAEIMGVFDELAAIALVL